MQTAPPKHPANVVPGAPAALSAAYSTGQETPRGERLPNPGLITDGGLAACPEQATKTDTGIPSIFVIANRKSETAEPLPAKQCSAYRGETAGTPLISGTIPFGPTATFGNSCFGLIRTRFRSVRCASTHLPVTQSVPPAFRHSVKRAVASKHSPGARIEGETRGDFTLIKICRLETPLPLPQAEPRRSRRCTNLAASRSYIGEKTKASPRGN